jgi:hypothetical protein
VIAIEDGREGEAEKAYESPFNMIETGCENR